MKLMQKFSFQMRDLRAVGTKFYHVLYPKEKKALLKECEYISSMSSIFLSVSVLLAVAVLVLVAVA